MNLETQAARDGLLENLEFRTKSPFAGRLLIAEVAALGLKKWDKLLPCGDIVDIHRLDNITIFPAWVRFPHQQGEGIVINLSSGDCGRATSWHRWISLGVDCAGHVAHS